ncbi:unnamed protein product [Brachionus calyciflorus]|uniref:Uncharacterized protein n=1 Tax=Brachionus calyciflorus TaxID=104777 RepID=A0A814FKB4_9BILA|nr:unnamed protein product [Brachionus calyciflorus]
MEVNNLSYMSDGEFRELTTELDKMVDTIFMDVLKNQPDSFDRIANTCKIRKQRIIVNYSKLIFAYIQDNSIPLNRVITEIDRHFATRVTLKQIEKLKKLELAYTEIDKIFCLMYRWYKRINYK